MKLIFAIAMISCLIAMGLAQLSQDCVRRTTEVSDCTSRLATGGGDFCSSCANTLIRFYQDCARGAGVDQVKQRKPIKFCMQAIIS